MEHSADLFDGATILRLIGQLRTVLKAFAADPGRQIQDLPLLSSPEIHQILVEWNDTRSLLAPEDPCAHTLVEAQAARAPERIALIFEGESLTYAELNRRANRLAHRLSALGAGPESLVGICLERCLELPVAVLGVLKAGGAYVPIDPELPRERLDLILEDAGISIVLTREDLTGLTDGDAGENPCSGTVADNLMYLIYTSGSTGRPKGVQVAHRGVANRLLWAQRTYPLTAEDRVLQKAPFSFDVSALEIFTPLSAGGCLVLARPGGQRDTAYLVRTVCEQGITLIDFVPPMLQAFLAEEGAESCASLRSVSVGGETLAPELAALFSARSSAELRNQYGPTEASIDVADQVFRPEEAPRRSVPLGRPHANTVIHLLDRQAGICPIGVPGELCIGGVGLARGYLGSADLTAEKLVPDPFGPAGARLYRTGDLARRLPDGRLEFLGRIDHQVKLRGFRIELGEIEGVLRSHPAVGEAVVSVREDLPGGRSLVAYVVPGALPGPAAGELEEMARRALPDYMIPAAFVELAALPTTTTGKLDRAALPRPAGRSGRSGGPEAPRDAVEIALARIWEELLGAGPLGVREDFFRLGGHSLLLLALASRIARDLGRTLPVAALFQAPTIEDQAALLRRVSPGEAAGPRPCLVKIRDGARRPLFCIHPTGGEVMCYLELARSLDDDRPVYGVQAPELAAGEPGSASIEEMAARYLREIRKAQPEGPYLLAGWSLGGLVAFEMARQLRSEGEAAERLILIDTRSPTLPVEPIRDERELVLAFARDLAAVRGWAIPEDIALQVRAAEEPLRFLFELALAERLLPKDFEVSRLTALFAVFRRDLAALETYEAHTYTGPVALFVAEDRIARQDGPPDQGWRDLAEQLTIEPVPGNHWTMLSEPQVPRLTERLRAILHAPLEAK
jgi:amino acid adenylation domain-containing protein